jgi:sugar phosphate isomerase/epimerase
MSEYVHPSRRQFLSNTVKLGVVGALGAPFAFPQDSKPGWQIGCYTRPWAAFEYPVALDAIAEAGFSYAGLMTTNSPSHLVISAETTLEEAAQVGEACKARKLEVPSIYGGGIPVQESLEAGIAGLKRLIDNTEAVGATNLMMGGVTEPAQHEPYYKTIAECCDYAKGKGIGLSVKPHGGTNATGAELRALIDSVGNDNFRVWYDPGNIFYYSDGALDPIDDAPAVDGLVVGMSVKDYLPPKIVDLTPGTGQVDFTTVMEKLKAGGFTGGPLIIECLAPGELPQLLEEAKKARAFVEALVGG